MRRFTMNVVDLPNGERLGFRETVGGENPIVLVHGNMSSSKQWDTVMENIPEEFKVYAIDLRGFGVSTYHHPIDSLKDFSDDLKAICDMIGLKKFCLVGWSTGGGVCMKFAIDFPEYVRQLILVESVGIKGYPIPRLDETGQIIPGEFLKTKEEIADDAVTMAPIVQAFQRKDKVFVKNLWDALVYTEKKPSQEKYEEYLDDILTQRNLVDVYYALSNFNISYEHNGVTHGTGEVDKINVPTRVIHGENDQVIPLDCGKEIKEMIGKNTRLEILKNCGHAPMVDCLEELIHQIVSFTKE
ncbi:MAG: alpha/beta fold hydrolase [Bacillota bacterium]